MKSMAILLFGVFALAVPETVMGFCFEPSPPSPPSAPFVTLPGKPFCADYAGGVGDCSQWEIDSYQADIKRYIRAWDSYTMEVQRYHQDATQYAEEALEFANCQANEAVSEWNGFVGY